MRTATLVCIGRVFRGIHQMNAIHSPVICTHSGFSYFYCTQALVSSSGKSMESNLEGPKCLSWRIAKLPREESVECALQSWIGEGFPIYKDHIFHVINLLRKLGMNKRALEVMEWVIREKPYIPKELDYSHLLEFTAEVHGIKQGERLFSCALPEYQYELLSNNLVMACLDKGLIRLSFAYMKKMRELGSPISPLIFNRLMILHSSPSRKKAIPHIITQMKADKVPFNVTTYNILMKMEADEHNLGEVVKVFAKMKKTKNGPNAISYCILAATYAVAKMFTLSEVYIKALEKFALGRNWLTRDVLITLYGYLGKGKELQKMWDIVKELPQVRSKSYILAIEAFGRTGEVSQAEELFSEMKSEKVLTLTELFNSIIFVYCKHGLVSKAFEIYQEMEMEGWKPNAMTYRHLALGCLKANLVEETVKNLKLSMNGKASSKVRKSIPWLETTLSIAEIFAERGDVENADKLFKELDNAKYSRHAFVYNTLIKAYVKAKVYNPNILRRMTRAGARADAETYSLLKLAEQFRV